MVEKGPIYQIRWTNQYKKDVTIANKHKLSKQEKQNCLSSINSYLGIISHYKTFNFRKNQIIRYFEKWLKNIITFHQITKK